jgi:hypothetical protein
MSVVPVGASAAAEDRRPALDRYELYQRKLLEPCICGGEILSPSRLAQDIMDAVRRHQIEPIHISWDLANGIPLSAWQQRSVGV